MFFSNFCRVSLTGPKRPLRPTPRAVSPVAPGPAWDELAARFERAAERGEPGHEPGSASSRDDHLPVVQVLGGSQICVRTKRAHPMTAAHWLHVMYVRDQSGGVIALREFGREQPFPELVGVAPSLRFQLPPPTTSLVAYVYCSEHALFQSALVIL